MSIFKAALQARKFSRLFGVLLLIPTLVGAVGSFLAGKVDEASKTILIQIFVSPAYRPYLILFVCLITPPIAIEIVAFIEDKRSGSKDLRKYLREIARKNEMLTPNGFFQQTALGVVVSVPLDTVFIHLRAVSDRPRFDL